MEISADGINVSGAAKSSSWGFRQELVTLFWFWKSNCCPKAHYSPLNDVILKILGQSDISGQNVSAPNWFRAGSILCVSLHSIGNPIDFQMCVGGGEKLGGCFISSSSCGEISIILLECIHVQLWLWDWCRRAWAPVTELWTCHSIYLNIQKGI